MGAYNTIQHNVKCSEFGTEYEDIIQFKYGDTWQLSYRLNDAIIWGGNDIGIKISNGSVVVDGVGEACPFCNRQEDYYIFVINNTITKIVHANGEYNFAAKSKTYIILSG